MWKHSPINQEALCCHLGLKATFVPNYWKMYLICRTRFIMQASGILHLSCVFFFFGLPSILWRLVANQQDIGKTRAWERLPPMRQRKPDMTYPWRDPTRAVEAFRCFAPFDLPEQLIFGCITGNEWLKISSPKLSKGVIHLNAFCSSWILPL